MRPGQDLGEEMAEKIDRLKSELSEMLENDIWYIKTYKVAELVDVSNQQAGQLIQRLREDGHVEQWSRSTGAYGGTSGSTVWRILK